MDANPFAPLGKADRARVASIATAAGAPDDDSDILELMPCQGPVPAHRTFRHRRYGEPSRVWPYTDKTGALMVVVARYDYSQPDGTSDKDVLPWSHGRRRWTNRSGKVQDHVGWHCKAPPKPRPLYGLDRLTAHPGAPVLVAEGEKASEAAAALFPDLICVTSLGGSKSPAQSDWMPLCGRRVAIWPDNDEPGAKYAAKVAELARRTGASSVCIVEVPEDWPGGWDLADALPDGVTQARLRELLDDAPDNTAAEMPPGFRMTAKGLFFDPQPSEKNPEPLPIFVCAPCQVLGETRDATGEAWGVFLRWRDREGRRHQWAIPRRLIHRPGNEIAEELEHAGLQCGSDSRAHDLLKRFIGSVRVPRLLRCVTRTGWHTDGSGPVFVLPGGEAFGRRAADTILQAEYASADAAYRAAGSLAEWQSKVAARAIGNYRLALSISTAFAGPLLDIMSEASGGIHFVGNSRTGKSTMVAAAAGVWGKPTADAQLRTWRGTANGLEGTAADTTDTLLVLDEMGQADSREVGEIVYLLANEAGKQRASRTGTTRRRQSWRVVFLSTGEVSLAQKMGEAGKRTTAGLEVRLVNLPADAGAGMGVFQTLHGMDSAAALAEALRDAARAHHGHAGRVFLARLARDRANDEAGLRERLAAWRDRFMAAHVPKGAAGQVRSVAGRLGLIAAAGELAREYGVLPWPEGEALRAAGACFAAWLDERGGFGPAEEQAALAQVRAFLEKHGESRFTALVASSGNELEVPIDARTVNRAGFRRRTSEDVEYLVLPEAWKEVCRGLDPKWVADLLAERGFLLGVTPRSRSVSERIPGFRRVRVYRLSGAILDHGITDDAKDSINDAI